MRVWFDRLGEGSLLSWFSEPADAGVSELLVGCVVPSFLAKDNDRGRPMEYTVAGRATLEHSVACRDFADRGDGALVRAGCLGGTPLGNVAAVSPAQDRGAGRVG